MKYWLHITSGRGPDECSLFAAKVIPLIEKEAKTKSIKIDILYVIKGNFNTVKSALLSVEGENIDSFIHNWNGTLQWICESTFRPNHKRKNWFIGIEAIKPPEDNTFSNNEIIIETMRSSGPGGQHVNKSESAVRIKHIPTGIVVSAQEERSQYMNKKLAMARLEIAISEKQNNSEEKLKQDIWSNHNELVRGNPIKTFMGDKLIEK